MKNRLKKVLCSLITVSLCSTLFLGGCGKQGKDSAAGKTADGENGKKEIVVATTARRVDWTQQE